MIHSQRRPLLLMLKVLAVCSVAMAAVLSRAWTIQQPADTPAKKATSLSLRAIGAMHSADLAQR